jgi:hypothetical protein
MKKITLPILLLLVLPLAWSCAGLKGLGLSDKDAANALKQMLSLGVRDGLQQGFNKEAVLTAMLPEPARKAVRTAETLGLSPELDRFTTTLGTVAEKTAATSIPVFQNSIDNLSFVDAVRLVKAGGTSATDYLRTSAGDSLRRAIKPIMQAAIAEHKLNDEWDKLTKPVRSISANRMNLDLASLMAGMVSEAMFRQIAAKETAIRTEAAARTTPLLRQVFSRNWN